MKADVLALAAIALWGSLAPLGVQLAHIPPFLLTGIGLLIGSLIALFMSLGANAYLSMLLAQMRQRYLRDIQQAAV